jgi:hypothetical protein
MSDTTNQPGTGPEITHLLIPNDTPGTTKIRCTFCNRPAAGAVQVTDEGDDAKPQTYLYGCEKHKQKAIAEAARRLRTLYKKRVVIEGPNE